MSSKESELVRQIIEKTDAKLIPWEPTARLDEFVAPYKGQVTFTVTKYDDPSYYGDSFKLVMRDRDNREMLTLDRSFVESGLLDQLYRSAHNSALKVEETIDALLQDLRGPS
jgi:hypothetical protein